MAKGYKNTTTTCTIREALDWGGDLEDLHSEMEEWSSNMESNSMEHLPKYEAVQEAMNALENKDEITGAAENLAGELEGIGLACDSCGTVKCVLDVEIEVDQMEPYKGRSYPRWMRLQNSTAPYQAVIGYFEDSPHLVDIDKEEEDADEKLLAAYRLVIKDSKHGDKLKRAEKALAKIVTEKRVDALQAKRKADEDGEEEEEDEVEVDYSELESALSEMENVEFPGMFG